MNAAAYLALVLDPARIFPAQGLTADAWQVDLLRSTDPFILLNCSRQAGKSTAVAGVALHQILTRPKQLVLLVAPSERQSRELFRKVLAGFFALRAPLPSVRANQGELELANGSRLVALPGREETIRSFSGVSLLILDEAARVPDDLYRSVRPMLAVSRGRLIALSTPFGRRGWFFDEWEGSGPWRRFRIPWNECPRISPDFIAEELRALGQPWVDREYGCLFTVLEGLVYPDFQKAVFAPTDDWTPPSGQLVGGLDFGWKNPFAAVWGVLDRSDVLWILQERYGTGLFVDDVMPDLPNDATWYADPAGRETIERLRRSDFTVRPGKNAIQYGIALVTSRLRTGRLKIAATCEKLCQEAGRYRYPKDDERSHATENPIDADNHALAALRYLVATIETPG